MNKIPKVSVLVPIFNVELYLEQALDSLISQTLQNIEFICINDGSTDRSREILGHKVKNDKRFIVIDKVNTGYGDSMNHGLKLARGEYIGVLEPDDFLERDAFEKLYIVGHQKLADMVRSNYYEYSDHGRNEKHLFDQNMSGYLLRLEEKRQLFRMPPAIWSGIYRRELLCRWQIDFMATPGASFQDTGFYFKTLIAAKRIVVLDQAFLNYRIDNPQSSVKSSKKVFEIMQEHRGIKEFLTKNGLLDQYSAIIEVAKFANYYWNLNRLDASTAQAFVCRMHKEFLDDQKRGYIQFQSFPVKYRVALCILLKNPTLFLWLSQKFN